MGEVDRVQPGANSSVALYPVPPLTEDKPVTPRAPGDEYESVRRVVRFLEAEAEHDGRLSPLWRYLAERLRERFLRGPRPPRR